ncbi:MAG: ABC transporter substrate binding protein [Thermodesulfovibrio sp.]|uniref:ABC transporter substrate-binding protein n=1 Tax=unclassified Thermodesulfovibrio TaxID=2645936 RepID=UPI00083A4FE4|nr:MULTISPECIES: ABC transporter substrate binding protein [unclassified Thermodesulfovibrio]MDI1471703.1 ABC transporter substrate binding protein [Thermodesulfovibrio sp. 1176]MDI6713594.1 ABC transporter substrate binding protein [Thermodesulfovibrio sp.]ODA44270.1 two component sensor [Thermodesulfovibrio sp. N1]
MILLRKKILLFLITFIIPFLFACSDKKTVLILSSYDDKDVCGEPQVQGAVDYLKKEIENLKIDITYLDARRINKEELEKRCNEFRKKVESKKVSLIITADDAAFQCVAKHFMRTKIPVVFSGINITPEHYNEKFHFLEGRKPVKNFTGVYEKLFIPKQIELLEVLIGNVDKIAVLYSTDFIGEALKEQVIYELKASNFKNKLVFYPVSNLSELIKSAQEINKRKDITAYFPFVMSIKDGTTLTLKDVAPIITEKIKKIDLAINKQFVELGFFGGVSVDFYQMGYNAGAIASYIIRTGVIADIEVEDAEKYVKIINLKRAKQIKFNISDKQLSLFDEIMK